MAKKKTRTLAHTFSSVLEEGAVPGGAVDLADEPDESGGPDFDEAPDDEAGQAARVPPDRCDGWAGLDLPEIARGLEAEPGQLMLGTVRHALDVEHDVLVRVITRHDVRDVKHGRVQPGFVVDPGVRVRTSELVTALLAERVPWRLTPYGKSLYVKRFGAPLERPGPDAVEGLPAAEDLKARLVRLQEIRERLHADLEALPRELDGLAVEVLHAQSPAGVSKIHARRAEVMDRLMALPVQIGHVTGVLEALALMMHEAETARREHELRVDLWAERDKARAELAAPGLSETRRQMLEGAVRTVEDQIRTKQAELERMRRGRVQGVDADDVETWPEPVTNRARLVENRYRRTVHELLFAQRTGVGA